MGNLEKKQNERNSLNYFIKGSKDPFVQKIKAAQDFTTESQERPDIVLYDNDYVYGIEHISIPLCKEGKGGADQVRQGREKRVFGKYKIDEENGIDNLKGNENIVVEELNKIVNKTIDANAHFTYEEYISTCNELLRKHNAKVYYENIKIKFPEKKAVLCYLLDISYPNEVKGLDYKKNKNANFEYCVRRDYPFTFEFLDLLQRIPFVDKFLLIWHPNRSYEEKLTRCYVLDTQINMEKQVPRVWESFDIPVKYKRAVHVNLSYEQ